MGDRCSVKVDWLGDPEAGEEGLDMTEPLSEIDGGVDFGVGVVFVLVVVVFACF